MTISRLKVNFTHFWSSCRRVLTSQIGLVQVAADRPERKKTTLITPLSLYIDIQIDKMEIEILQ